VVAKFKWPQGSLGQMIQRLEGFKTFGEMFMWLLYKIQNV